MTTEIETSFDLGSNDTKRYTLPPEEVQKRVRELLETREPVSIDGLTCYVLDDRKDEDLYYGDISRTLEGDVFFQRFEDTPQDLVNLYGEHDKRRQNLFMLAIDTNIERAVGTLRMVRDFEDGDETHSNIPTIRELAKTKENPGAYIKQVYDHYGVKERSKCWDIAMAAVPEEFRGTEASARVYRAGLKEAQDRGVEDFFAIIDEIAYRPMQKLGFPFEPLPGETWMPFAGSELSLPVHGKVKDFEPSIRARKQALIAKGMARIATRLPFDVISEGNKDDAIQ